jgi:D-cysteine desulfhydrase
MNLAKFPRRRYTAGQTPLEHLKRFSEEVGGPNIFVKRDDLLGLTAGGNKTRKLEFLVADALLQGADTLVTCGAVQSNHCRLTLSAAVKEGLQCHLVLEERVAGSYKPKGSGNNFLFHVLGADSISVAPGGSRQPAESPISYLGVVPMPLVPPVMWPARKRSSTRPLKWGSAWTM